MFGASARHLYTGILGIRQREGTAGYCDLVIHPYLPENLNYASGKIETVKGDIFVSLQRKADNVVVSFSVPQGIKVELPMTEGYIFNVHSGCEKTI